MKVVWSERFRQVYASDPAAVPGRLEEAHRALDGWAEWVEPERATEQDLLDCHTPRHLERVRREGVYDMAALAAGGAIAAARIAVTEPAFALVRPPGHHASADRSWGFCYFNNLAVSLAALHREGAVENALVLDFDLHHGDGTVNILGHADWVRIVNPGAPTREEYRLQVINALEGFEGDCIAVSAGFDHHRDDWGGLLLDEDYGQFGLRIGFRAGALGALCYGVLEGGYNHRTTATSLKVFLEGMEKGWSYGRPSDGRARG